MKHKHGRVTDFLTEEPLDQFHTKLEFSATEFEI